MLWPLHFVLRPYINGKKQGSVFTVWILNLVSKRYAVPDNGSTVKAGCTCVKLRVNSKSTGIPHLRGITWVILKSVELTTKLTKLSQNWKPYRLVMVQFAVSEEEETFKCSTVWLFFLEMEYIQATTFVISLSMYQAYTVQILAIYDLIHRANALKQNNNTAIKCKINGKRLSRLVSDSTSDWENKIRMYYTIYNHFSTADPTQLKAWT